MNTNVKGTLNRVNLVLGANCLFIEVCGFVSNLCLVNLCVCLCVCVLGVGVLSSSSSQHTGWRRFLRRWNPATPPLNFVPPAAVQEYLSTYRSVCLTVQHRWQKYTLLIQLLLLRKINIIKLDFTVVYICLRDFGYQGVRKSCYLLHNKPPMISNMLRSHN